MELPIIDEQGQCKSTLAASDALFGREYNEAVVHQVVTAYMANARLGTRAQKARGEVNKSNKKPWRQKGTGRARAGRASSPLWRGGGKIFPSSPDENFSHKVNRKVYRAGIAAILSQLAREGRLQVVESFAVDAPKTRVLAQKLRGMGLDEVLIVTDSVDENLVLSSRNLPRVLVVEPGNADPVSLLRFEKTIITRGAVALMQVLVAPQVSEKSTFVGEKNNQWIFRVRPDASKPEIKAAVELMFKVEVLGVQTSNLRGKETKRAGRPVGRRRSWKKAFVRLKPGQEISFAPGDNK
jgi:large subunit ribosomal protein L4